MTTTRLPPDCATRPIFEAFPDPTRRVRDEGDGAFDISQFELFIIDEPVNRNTRADVVARLLLQGREICGDARLLWLVENQHQLSPEQAGQLRIFRDGAPRAFQKCWIYSAETWGSPSGRAVARCLDYDENAGEWRRGYWFVDRKNDLQGVVGVVLIRKLCPASRRTFLI